MVRIDTNDRLAEKRREVLADEQAKNRSDLDYIAMMCEIELEQEVEDARPEV